MVRNERLCLFGLGRGQLAAVANLHHFKVAISASRDGDSKCLAVATCVQIRLSNVQKCFNFKRGSLYSRFECRGRLSVLFGAVGSYLGR